MLCAAKRLIGLDVGQIPRCWSVGWSASPAWSLGAVGDEEMRKCRVSDDFEQTEPNRCSRRQAAGVVGAKCQDSTAWRAVIAITSCGESAGRNIRSLK